MGVYRKKIDDENEKLPIFVVGLDEESRVMRFKEDNFDYECILDGERFETFRQAREYLDEKEEQIPSLSTLRSIYLCNGQTRKVETYVRNWTD